MVRVENPDSCAICGNELPEDPPCVTLPGPFTPAMTPLADPGIRKIAFCSDRHRQDWLDAKRGKWPEGVEEATVEEKD